MIYGVSSNDRQINSTCAIIYYKIVVEDSYGTYRPE